ncbi:MAG: nitrous oxide-stimulated promoter family protein [Catonella sp.]|nr:nitrous oxide-stimulated promoter family protein [Catonella sp.]MDY6357194.1 nitrous oxide-stimulated promoter family protein [Catonella sp.]
MVLLYCKRNHNHNARSTDDMCPDCKELLNYARTRSEKCLFKESKTFCSFCKVHCYKPEMREKIRTVMKFSGPRMLFVHPIATIRHLWLTLRAR